MPSGLLLAPNDGGPRMEITAGLRCPSYSLSIPDTWDVNQYTLPNYVAGSQIVMMPKSCVYSLNRGTNLIASIAVLDSITVSGGTVTQNVWWSDNWGRAKSFPATVWQILPASSGRGLLIQNSTDFMAITDNTMVGQCVWRGTVTINGAWTTPAITGLSRDQYLVFAKWDAPNVVIDYDGVTIRVLAERDGDDVAASATLQIAIFASGIAPVPGRGLNMINAAGKCVFSTTKRPFVYRNATWAPNWNGTDIGNTMIMLGRFGYDSTVASGWDWLKFAGLVRTGNVVRCGKGKVSTSWTANYPVTGRRLTSIAVPCIDAMY